MPLDIGIEDKGKKTYLFRGSYKTIFWLAVIGIVLFMLFGHSLGKSGYWNLNIPYPAGVTTNPADVQPGVDGRPWNGSGYPMGTFVGDAAGFYAGGVN